MLACGVERDGRGDAQCFRRVERCYRWAIRGRGYVRTCRTNHSANEEEAKGSAGSPSLRRRPDRPLESLDGDGRLQGQSRTQLPLVGLSPPSGKAYSARLADGAALDMMALRRLIDLRRFEDAYRVWVAAADLDLQQEAAVSIVASLGEHHRAVRAIPKPC